ncbi:MAG: RES family NAD+ phosphorylase [Allosphingosinicella sp.]|uniref:RES family NAD+ phosphorylase n=1 Tax=Allosphingosinicella sp. TaxID=2823234 RepID=UPI003923DAE0
MAHRIRHISDRFYRLIPSRFPPVDLYERFGSPALVAGAQRLEGITNPRLASRQRIMTGPQAGTVNPNRLQNWNHAPFAYRNPEGTYWLDPAYGALDLAADEETALAIAVQRREQFLRRTSEPAIDLDMRLLITPVEGDFVDFEEDEPAVEEIERRRLGRVLYEEGVSGILHRRSGLCNARFLSVFKGRVLGASVQATHYRFVWDGSSIRSVYDFGSEQKSTPDSILAAVAQRWAA